MVNDFASVNVDADLTKPIVAKNEEKMVQMENPLLKLSLPDYKVKLTELQIAISAMSLEWAKQICMYFGELSHLSLLCDILKW